MLQFSSKSLLYFKTVCEWGTIRYAATVLKIAHSAISRQISLLEKSLSVQLFVRTKTHMHLTPYGEKLLEYIHELEYRQNLLVRDVNNIKTSDGGKITIAMGAGFSQDAIDNLIGHVHISHPNIKLSILTESLSGIQKIIQKGTADIGLTYKATPSKHIRILHNSIQPMCAILPANHVLAGDLSIKLKDLQNEKVAMCDIEHSVSSAIINSASIQKIDLNIVLHVNSLALLIDCVAQGNHVCFLPAFCVRKYIEQGLLVAIPLTDIGLSNPYTNIIVRNDSFISPVMQSTINIILSKMKGFKQNVK